jgi:hypothetical protein
MPEPKLLVHIKLAKPSRLRKFQTKCPAISARSIFSLYPKIRKNDRSQKLGKIVVCNWASTLSNIGLENLLMPQFGPTTLLNGLLAVVWENFI